MWRSAWRGQGALSRAPRSLTIQVRADDTVVGMATINVELRRLLLAMAPHVNALRVDEEGLSWQREISIRDVDEAFYDLMIDLTVELNRALNFTHRRVPTSPTAPQVEGDSAALYEPEAPVEQASGQQHEPHEQSQELEQVQAFVTSAKV